MILSRLLQKNISRIESKNEKEKRVFENNSNILKENIYPSQEIIRPRIEIKNKVFLFLFLFIFFLI